MNVCFKFALQRTPAVLIGVVIALMSRADSDEAWLLRAPLPPGIQPLLALIIDSSAATGRTISVDEPYDTQRDYGMGLPVATRCQPARVYWRRGPGPVPDCTAQAGLDLAPAAVLNGLQCDSARVPLVQSGFFIASRAAQWSADPDGGYWSALQADSQQAVECRADRGRHGARPGSRYASDGPDGPWSDSAASEIGWDRSPHADPYIFYSGNYLNYLRSVRMQTDRTLADVISQSLAQALSATEELEVALIRVDNDGPEGGYVARAPIESLLAAADLQSLGGEPPSGSAPLAETLVEAAVWLSGGPIRFGSDERADHAAMNPAAQGSYLSPFTHACRPVSLAYLTAGEPSDDDLAATAAGALPRFDELTGGCVSNCLLAISQWIRSADLRDDLAGVQTAPIAWITPDTPSSLGDSLTYINLIARSLQHDAAVPANPQLSAAAMATIAGDSGGLGLVFGLTAPLARQRWVGNLLRYALRAPASPLAPPTIIDRDGAAAIDAASGLPMATSRSLWSDAPDANLLAGGAAGRLPVAEARRIHTNIASARILDPANRLDPANPRFDRQMVGLGASDPESLQNVLGWTAEQRMIGDPGPHSPIVVDYPESGRQVVFAATHDGLLQAFDADSGIEIWAWLPLELLPRLPELMRDESTTVRRHGIDGPLVLHRHDPDGDAHIDAGAGEHLWLLFGLGRGGNRYYAVDIASPDDPKLLWSSALPGDSRIESRAEPVVSRFAIQGSGQSDDDWVVLLAGGYDRRFDSNHAEGAGAGNALHMFDAVTGRKLWSGGDNDDDFEIAGLVSLPSAPRAMDLNGDGYLDRAYLADVNGGLWRLDFTSGRAAGEVARVRQLARLGTGAHRFYATPDAAVARVGDENVIALALGSGWLARPRDASVVDRIYTIFDRAVPEDKQLLVESDLYDATNAASAMPPTAPGWHLRLEEHGAGEKVIGPMVTFDHVLRFQTYQPLADDESTPCGPPRSVLRLHALDIRSGIPYASSVESQEDEADEIAGSGLPVGLRFGFPDRWEEACPGCRPRPFGIVGGDTFDSGYAGDPVKTSWRKL
ncbi:MAG: PilC/PilY family type IV pilus protein, partial [Steroidobacteraceae bacterium]